MKIPFDILGTKNSGLLIFKKTIKWIRVWAIYINFIKNFKKESQIDKIYLAASGGPFLFRDIKFNQDVKSVLNHPTWKMGKKITVDSSTFANKVLELFEAKILFDIKAKDIKMIVEQKSNVHTIIKLKNN